MHASIQHKFCVYVYVDASKRPYYVGQGVIGRPFASSRKVKAPPRSQIRIKFLRTQWEAWGLEMLLIAKWGKKAKGGLLLNSSSGGIAGGFGVERDLAEVEERTTRRAARIKNGGLTTGEVKALAALKAKQGRATQLWRIYFASGKTVEIFNLRKFCQETGYNHPCLSALSRGQRRFHRDIVKVEKISDPELRQQLASDASETPA